MPTLSRFVLVASLSLVPASALLAQTSVNPSGHWEGKVEVPGQAIGFEIDIAPGANGEFVGTADIPAQKLKALPLLQVAVQGNSIRFFVRSDQTFSGDFFDGGKSMSGTMAVDGTTLPFSLTRTGDARLDTPLTSPAVGKDLEGTWNATVGGKRVALRLVNRPDGTAIARIINIDQGGMEFPVAVAQHASSVTFESTAIAGSFSGTLNADATELAGTWTEGPAAVPLTFTRGAK